MTSESSFAALTTAIGTLLPDRAGLPIRREDSMAELGLDSVDRAEVLLLALEALGMSVPVTRFHGAADIGELADRIDAARRA